MKTKVFKFGKRLLSVLLSVLMIVSTFVIMGTVAPIKAAAAESIRIKGTTVQPATWNAATNSWTHSGSAWDEVGLTQHPVDTNIYYADIYIQKQTSTQTSEFGFMHGKEWRAYNGSSVKDVYAYDLNTNVYQSKNGNVKNFYFNSNTGYYRIVYFAYDKKFCFRSLNLKLRSSGVYDTEGGTVAGWVDGFTFTRESATDYAVDVYISDAAKAQAGGFKLYSPTFDQYYTKYTGIVPNSTRNGSVNFDTRGGANNCAYLNGDAGNYTIHYDPSNYDVWITPNESSYTITTSSELQSGTSIAYYGSNVTTANNTTTASKGSIVTVTVTPPADVAANVEQGTSAIHYITNVLTVTGDSDATEEIPITQTGINTFTFQMPDQNVTVNATFKENSFVTVTTETVTTTSYGSVTTTSGGTAQASYTHSSVTTTDESVSAEVRDPVTLTATANQGYLFDGWEITGTYYTSNNIASDATLTIYPATDVTAKAKFKEDPGEEQTWYIFYRSDDNFDNTNVTTYKIHVYKKASSHSKAVNGYIYYADLNVEDMSNCYFDSSGEDNLYKMYYYHGSSTKDDSSKFNLEIEENSGMTGEKKHNGHYNFIGVYGLGNINKVRVYITDRDSDNNPDYDSFYVEVLERETYGFTANESVNVWAKRGTTRNGAEGRNDGTYSEYYATSTTVETVEGSTLQGPYSKEHNTVNKYIVTKGDTIRITTKVRNTACNRVYVKAFVINGYAYGVIDENDVTQVQRAKDNSGGIYTYTYKIPEDLSEDNIEITPVFFYFTDNNSDNKQNEYITFYVEDFEGTVKNAWGNTISCYAWYSDNKNDDKSDTKRGAIGGYPGQPMIYDSGSYYMQVPKYLYTKQTGAPDTELENTESVIQGITMNNYYWDDVHVKYGDKGNLGINCQTYDYDDFVALMDYDTQNRESIVFSFKYRTKKDNGNNGGSWANQLQSNHELHWLYDQFGKSNGNGWNPLVDYYHVSVDIFGFKRTKTVDSVTSFVKENEIKDQFAQNVTLEAANSSTCKNDPNWTKFLYVVSDGYSTAESAYIGYYATKWHIYNEDGEHLVDLPPSAFIFDFPENQTGDLDPNNPDTKFLGYSAKASASTNSEKRSKLWQAYCTLYNAKDGSGNYLYRGLPVMISYEKAIADKGVKYDYGNRNDGRWYFSRTGAKISANIRIEVVNSNGDIIYKDNFTSPNNPADITGPVTGAKAYFTNSGFNQKNASGEVTQNPESDFTFKADGISTGKKLVENNGTYQPDENTTAKYEFVGWYLYNEDEDLYSNINVGNNINNVNGTKPMISDAKLVARYVEVTTPPEGELKIAHLPYASADTTKYVNSPEIGDGSGTTSVQVKILDSTGNVLSTVDKTSGTAKVTLGMLLQQGAKYLEVTLYSEDNDTITAVYRDTCSAYSPIYDPENAQVYDTDSRNSGDAGPINDLTTGAPETLKYVYDISSFLLDGETIKSDKKEIYYYTNYDKGRQLTVTHELLKAIVDNREQGVTEQAALDSIVGKNFNKITPHEDMFVNTSVTPNEPTTTKVTISVSADGTNYNAVQNAVNVDTATLKPSDLSGKSYVKITLTTTPGTGTFDKNDYYFKGKYYTGSDMYYNPTEASSTQTTYLYNTNAQQQPTTGLTTCEFIVPVANIFDNESSKFVTEYLRFYSDPQKTIDIVVKYYDREVISNKPAHISEEPTTINLKYGVAPYGKENTYSNFKNDNTGILDKFKDVDNILDEYDFWLEQSQALESIKSKKFYYYAKDKTVGNVKNYTYNDYFTNKTTFAKYFNVEVGQIDSNLNVNDVLKYHTNYNGMPNTSGEKWVTYKDSIGNEISDEQKATTTHWTDVKTIVIWGYNAPKPYKFTAYFTPSQVNNNGEKIPLIYQDNNDEFEMTDVDKSVLYDNDDNNNNNGTHQVLIDKNTEYGVIQGFFNQRLGKVTSTTNDTSGYLGSYGITTPYFGDPGGVIGTGYDITADQTATYIDGNGIETSYVFDGWYIKDKYGYHKYSNETTYDERVVCDLSIYAGYVKVEIDNEVDNTYHDKIGVSVTWNGIDHYVDEQQNEMVRVNTELCVYGTEIKDNDDQIVDIASIYFNVPTQGTITGTTYYDKTADINWKDPRNKQALIEEFNEPNTRNNLRAQIKTHIDRLEEYYSTHENIGCYHSSNNYEITVEIEDIKLNHGVIDYYTYRVQDSIDYNTAHTNPDAKSFKLTNKNRIQFVMPITKEKYEATPFLAFVAMRCKDKDASGNFIVAPKETYTWYVSDNFVSNFGVENLPSTEYPPKPDPDDNTPEDFITPIEAGSDKSDINVSESIQDYNDSKEETNDTIQKYDVSSEEINDTKQQIDDTYDALLDNKDIVVTEF